MHRSLTAPTYRLYHYKQTLHASVCYEAQHPIHWPFRIYGSKKHTMKQPAVATLQHKKQKNDSITFKLLSLQIGIYRTVAQDTD